MSETDDYETVETASMKCPICGLATPHAHTPYEVERERYMRPRFEKWFADNLLWLSKGHGLNPAGTYGWALFWSRRNSIKYQMTQVETAWTIWQCAWTSRGDMFPEMTAAVRTACGAEASLAVGDPT